jgi:polyisoprenoid-binding protein YceI
MKTLRFASFAVVIGFFSACTSSPEGTDAEVGEAQEVTEASVEAQDYSVNTESSTVAWIGSKPTGKHNGTIPVTSGTIAVEEGNIVGGKVTMDVLNIQNEDLAEDPENQDKLVNHLKSPEFFDAENHPNAVFEITSVEAYDPSETMEVKDEYDTEYAPVEADEYVVDSPTHKITGNLTMRGTTKSVSFPAHVEMSDNTISAKAKFNIDRTAWGLSYGDEASAVDKAKDQFIYNTVNLALDITASADSATM